MLLNVLVGYMGGIAGIMLEPQTNIAILYAQGKEGVIVN